ncbi:MULTISPECIES: hypothetical protein [Kribbella]|uniref:hypothetical protein n=1 Tax=Kribbella TaxID=182639 RepID=UPI001305145B|nr:MULTISPECIES: hypothetical protein [Kribbella]
MEIGPLDDPLDEATRYAAAEALRAWIVDQDLEQSFVGGGPASRWSDGRLAR